MAGDSSEIADIDIWRSAKQIIDLYPVDPEMEAAGRADAAYEQGDMFNFTLWTRINKAVAELVRQKPAGCRLN